MTNMQHYMDDIQDLLDGLNEEMAKRLRKMEKWEGQITEKTVELKKLQKLVFDESKPRKQRADAAHILVDLKDEIRLLAEKKTELAEKNHSTVQRICDKLAELAYHCKCEVEIDNPGCTEQREREFYKSLDKRLFTSQSLMDALPGGSRKRESSVLTDDGTSTRSVTPFNGSIRTTTKKGPGRPRLQKSSKFKNAHFERIPENSAVSSTRSSMDPEPRPVGTEKKLSKYMRKKQEKQRLLEEEQRSMFEVKKEVDSGDYESFALNDSWMGGNRGASSSNAIASSSNQAEASTAYVDLCEEDERDLLDCLNFSGLPSPPKGMMEDMDVTESALYSMEMYPPGHKSSPEFRHPSAASASNAGRGGNNSAASSSQSFTPRSNNGTAGAAAAFMAASSSISDSSIHVDKRNSGSSSTQRNTLFGSIPDTSFSGRPRKLTDRVSEMIAANANRVKNHPKKYREQEEWCICNGANTNSDMMVECENSNCPIEWFHFGCVGLDASPQNEWYCPECRELSPHTRSSQLHL